MYLKSSVYESGSKSAWSGQELRTSHPGHFAQLYFKDPSSPTLSSPRTPGEKAQPLLLREWLAPGDQQGCPHGRKNLKPADSELIMLHM
jgi:hypothetical protein